MQDCPNYRWLGALPHDEVRRRIQRAGLLVHPSRMEGGAHVVIEAIRSSTAVLASGIDGNIGLLGEAYEGYFPVGNAQALASLITSAREVPGMLEGLRKQVMMRAERFAPEHEKAVLLEQVGEAPVRTVIMDGDAITRMGDLAVRSSDGSRVDPAAVGTDGPALAHATGA